MFNGKKLMCLTLFPTFFIPCTLTTPPSTPMQIIEKQVDNKEVIHTDKFGLIKNPLIEKLKKHKDEFEKKKTEEEKLKEEKQKDLEKQDKESPTWQEFELTFYSSLSCENSGNGTKSVTCTGDKLYDGVVASNYYKLNTKIQLQGWGEVTVLDRGSDKYFNNDYRLDVYIPRNKCESDSNYYSRVNKMGRVKVRGIIIK